jgi:hypothetical protein
VDAPEQQEPDTEAGTLALGQRLVANAFRYRTARPADTRTFRDLRHDANLVPQVTQQLRFLMEGFHRDTNVTYDIQGMSDEGSDVLLCLQSARDARFIGIQIKSHKELRLKGIVSELREQLSRSEDRYDPMLRWYIFLGADISDKMDRVTSRRVRDIQSAFVKKSKVTIVDPVYAVTFLRLSKAQMDSLTTLTLRTGDPLVEDAAADLRRHPVEAALLLRLVTNAVGREDAFTTLGELDSDSWIRQRYLLAYELEPQEFEFEQYVLIGDLQNEVLHEFLASQPRKGVSSDFNWPSRLAIHIDRLSDEVDDGGNMFRAPIHLHPALYALAAEGYVKHGLEFDELIEYPIDVILGE